jgi:ribose 5-phosphate isomerase B
MVIYLGADHRGFELKQYLAGFLKGEGYSVADLGNAIYDENDDYPTFAAAVAEKVSIDYEGSRGILICGSGMGMCIVANKYMNVRAAFAAASDHAFDGRTEDNTNMLCLGANYTDAAAARQIVTTWLTAPFSQEPRYARRLKEIGDLETKLCVPREGGERKKPLAWK